MRRFLAVMLVCILALSLVACGGSASTADSAALSEGSGAEAGGSDEEYTLTVWYWGEQEAPGYKAYMDEMVARYEEQNPGITVEAVLQESDTLYSAFRTAESAGEGPDVQYFWGGTQALEDVWMGNVVPISDYLTEEELSIFPQDTLNETNWGGKQWGIPAYLNIYVMLYNKDLMREAGIDPESPYTTYDEFIECCDKLVAADITPMGMGLKDGWLPAWIGIYFGQQNMDNPNDMISLMRGEQSFTDEKYGAWLTELENWKNKGYINEDILSLDLYQGQQLVESGEAAMTLHTQAYAVSLEEAMGSESIGVAPYPVYGSGELADSIAAPSQVYMIPKSAEHKEGAAQFLMFLQEEENVKTMYELTKTIMPSSRFNNDWLESEVDKQVGEWLDTKPNFCYQVYFAPMFEVEGLIPTVQKMFSEDMSAADACAELDEMLVKVQEQNPEAHEAFLNWNIE